MPSFASSVKQQKYNNDNLVLEADSIGRTIFQFWSTLRFSVPCVSFGHSPQTSRYAAGTVRVAEEKTSFKYPRGLQVKRKFASNLKNRDILAQMGV